MNEQSIPKGFKGFVFTPTNEQETLALFIRLMERIKPTWCVKKLQGDFPDGVFYDTETGADIRAEFEYRASNFISHNHDSDGCEYIVCWENDLSDVISGRLRQTVIALKEILSNLPEDGVCLGWKQEGSLDQILGEELHKNNRVALAVSRLINIEIPRLHKDHTGLFVDRNTTRHYEIRLNGKGFCGVYPSGRIVSSTVEEMVRKFGTEKIRDAAAKFRKAVKEEAKGLNVSPRVADEELNRRLSLVVDAIETICRRLEVFFQETSSLL